MSEPCPCDEPGKRCNSTHHSRDEGMDWYCTLRLGHAGEHIACGGCYDHRLATWPNEDARSPTEDPGMQP